MNKEELTSFNLWAKYYEFLTSLKTVFGEEIESQLNEKINSFIESEFYDENGNIKEGRKNDFPQYEVVYFKVENKKNFIDLSFSYSITTRVGVIFWSTDEKNERPGYEYECKTDFLFSSDIIEAVIHWIKTGKLTDFAKGVVKKM